MSVIAEEKKALRRQVREELERISPFEREMSDDALFRRFLALPQVKAARTIFAFWGIGGREPQTDLLIAELLRRGKRVCLPRMLPDRGMETPLYQPDRPLVPAGFGILEPDDSCPLVPKEEIDLVLVPALCYDRRGYRLGYGGGYYDRWLAGYTGFCVGLCRGAVLRDNLPAEEFDRRVDMVLTEGGRLSLPTEEKGGA